MKLPTSLFAFLLATTAQAVSSVSIAVSVPPSPPLLPNPLSLPPQTHATLVSPSDRRSAPLSAANTFVFHNISGPASYLLDVHAPTHSFVPLRVDVLADGAVAAWETYRGNDWDNKGEAIRTLDVGGGAAGFEARVAGVKGYYVERSKFNIINIVVKNPMILMGLVTMGIFLGMPYLMNNMDPEMRAEFEARQNDNPLSSILGSASGGATGQGAGAGQGFDMAGFLAGSASGGNGGGSGGSGSSAQSGGGKKDKRR